MMNKKSLPHIITAVSFVVLIVLGLACASTPPQWADVKYNGEDSKLLEGTIWGDGTLKFEFQPNGDIFATKIFMGGPVYLGPSSYERVGSDIKIVYDGGRYSVEGKFDYDKLNISGIESNSGGGKYNFALEFVGFTGKTQRFVNGLDTTLNGRWHSLDDKSALLSKDGKEVTDIVIGYKFLFGNFVTYKRYGIGDSSIIETLEKGTYTTDEKGTLTFKVTHTYDRTEKIFLTRDDFTARQKAQGKTAAQINDAIKEYFPDRSVIYATGAVDPRLTGLLGWKEALEFKDSIFRSGQYFKY